MLATTSVLVKTDGGREALSARRHDLQMRQRHLLILINGARTVGQLHQLLADWPDFDDLLTGLHDAGMVDVLNAPEEETAPAAAIATSSAPTDIATAAVESPASDATFDPIAYFNQPLFEDVSVDAALVAAYEGVPPLTGMTLGLQTRAAPVGEIEAANEPAAAPAQAAGAEPIAEPVAEPVSEPVVAPPPPPTTPPELADVLPNVVKVELMRLAVKHFGAAAGAVIPLLRTSGEDMRALCDVIAACSVAAKPQAGEQAAARFLDDALRALSLRRS
jgi:hypothetical protein